MENFGLYRGKYLVTVRGTLESALRAQKAYLTVGHKTEIKRTAEPTKAQRIREDEKAFITSSINA